MTRLLWPKLRRGTRWLLGVRDAKALDVLMFYSLHRRSARGYVAARSPEGKVYRVYLERDGALTCTCPDYLYRKALTRMTCKHIEAVLRGYALWAEGK